MPLSALVLHLSNFVAPALFLALVLPSTARFLPGQQTRLRWWQQVVLLFGVGVAVLVAGLVLHGRDGAMTTYAALVLACGTVQWWLLGASGRR